MNNCCLSTDLNLVVGVMMFLMLLMLSSQTLGQEVTLLHGLLTIVPVAAGSDFLNFFFCPVDSITLIFWSCIVNASSGKNMWLLIHGV